MATKTKKKVTSDTSAQIASTDHNKILHTVFSVLKAIVIFFVDLIWFVIDILHAVGFVIAALIASFALLLAAFGIFLYFIGVQQSTEFQKMRENMIHIESIRQTPDMMREEYNILNKIRNAEKSISEMRESAGTETEIEE